MCDVEAGASARLIEGQDLLSDQLSEGRRENAHGHVTEFIIRYWPITLEGFLQRKLLICRLDRGI